MDDSKAVRRRLVASVSARRVFIGDPCNAVAIATPAIPRAFDVIAGIDSSERSAIRPAAAFAESATPIIELRRPYSARSETSSTVASTREKISLGNFCATMSRPVPSFPRTASDSSSVSTYAKESASGLRGCALEVEARLESALDDPSDENPELERLLRNPVSLTSKGGSLARTARSSRYLANFVERPDGEVGEDTDNR